jgi:hypothetical protein
MDPSDENVRVALKEGQAHSLTHQIQRLPCKPKPQFAPEPWNNAYENRNIAQESRDQFQSPEKRIVHQNKTSAHKKIQILF